MCKNKIVDDKFEMDASPIFMLSVDHFEEIFEYLGLKDLHAISQTCKRLHQVAGYYFRENNSFANATLNCMELEFHETDISAFRQNIKRITIDEGTAKEFRFIGSDPFNSLDGIVL